MAFSAELEAMLGFPCGSTMRCGFGFHNPNHAAAFACASPPSGVRTRHDGFYSYGRAVPKMG